MACVLVLASAFVLVLYVHHSGQALRASGLIDLVGDALRDEIAHGYPPEPSIRADTEPASIVAKNPGVVLALNERKLVAAARQADCVLELVPMIGDFVPAGAPLLRARGETRRPLPEKLAKTVLLGPERTHLGDPAFALRKLVDIALRAIAQPFQDPTTAVQAIDRVHDGLRQLANRRFPTGEYRDSQGRLRLVVRTLAWPGYVWLAFDELRLASSTSIQVHQRLRASLEDVQAVAPAERRPSLDRQLDLLTGGANRNFEDKEDFHAAVEPDRQGIGSCADLLS
jgi:uncharacterized membrane protein